MKNQMTCYLIFFIGLVGHSSVFAQEAPRSSADVEKKLAAFLEQYPESDANQDGKLTREEVKAFRSKQRLTDSDMQARLKEAFKRFPEADADQNGTLTLDEFRDFQQSRRENSTPRREVPPVADVAYGDHAKQCFDLWPVPNAQEPTPLVIFIHGGGFRGGDKSNVSPNQVKLFHEAGVAFASMNYRLSDVGPYPIMMHDAARGLQTIRYRAKEWNMDPERIACFGGSAGAGISLWLALHDDLADPHSDDPISRQSTRIMAAGMTNGQPTYDMHTYRQWFGVPNLPMHTALLPFLGIQSEADLENESVKRKMADASPITHLSSDDRAKVYMTFGRPHSEVTQETPQGEWVHHVFLGLKLQAAMEELGMKCYVQAPGIPTEQDPYGSMETFLIREVSGISSE